MDGYCCERMHQAAEQACEFHPDRFACPDSLVHRLSASGEYGLIVHDGGQSIVRIAFCPWCGTRLPCGRAQPVVPQREEILSDVFLVWHVYELPGGDEDAKLIGVYSSHELAQQAQQRALVRPGFRDAPGGFCVDRYGVDQDHWTEGYVTMTHEDIKTPN